MNDLVVKNVNLFGDTVMAAKDKDGNIWASVRTLCEGMGLAKDQARNERRKIQEDLVLSKGESNLTLPTKGGNQEVLCLQLDYIPLWLSKISITPAMKENAPELVEKLVNYQLKAKDVLAAAFLPQRKSGRRRSVAQKDPIKFYSGENGVILVIGEDVYELDPDDCLFLEKFESKLHEMGVSKISGVLKAYIAVKFKKLECTSIISESE